MNDYGIPYELLLLPNGNIALPSLNSSSEVGNYGGIVVLSELSYSFEESNGGTSWTSALTFEQWNAIICLSSSVRCEDGEADGFLNDSPGT